MDNRTDPRARALHPFILALTVPVLVPTPPRPRLRRVRNCLMCEKLGVRVDSCLAQCYGLFEESATASSALQVRTELMFLQDIRLRERQNHDKRSGSRRLANVNKLHVCERE